MLRKFLLISVFALCASFYAYGPEWSSVSAQGTLPAAQPVPEDFADDFTGVTDPDVPTTSDDLAFSPTDGGSGSTADPATVGTDPTTGDTIVTLPVGFTNTSDEPLDNAILTVPLGDGQTLPEGSAWEEFTLDDGTRVAAYNAGTLAPGENVEIPVEIVDSSISPGDSVDLPTRLDATLADGTATSLAGTISHDTQAAAPVAVPLPENIDEILPDTSDEVFAVPDEPTTDLAFAPSTGDDSPTIPATVETDPDTGNAIVTLPVGFTNNTNDTLEDVILTVLLGDNETLPADSDWTEITLPDGTRVAAFNLGSLAAGQTAEIPFVYNSNNVAAEIAGEQIALPTRLDATDAAGEQISLAGEVAPTVQAPTSLEVVDEPSQNIQLFLPIISR